MIGALRVLAPHAQVIGNRVFVVDGPFASSAGITAGIAIALRLIAESVVMRWRRASLRT